MKIIKLIFITLFALILFETINVHKIEAQRMTSKQIDNTLTKTKLHRPSKVKGNQEIHFDIFLKSKNEKQYFEKAMKVNTPGNKEFKHYLTPEQIGNEFGQSNDLLKRLKTFLTSKNLKVKASKNKRVLFVSGEVNIVEKLFKVDLNKAKYHNNPLQFGNSKVYFPDELSNSIQAIVGLTDYNSNNVIPNSMLQFMSKKSKNNHAGGNTNTFTKNYHLNNLIKQGYNGNGKTVGIISLDGFRKSNVFHFWKHEHADTDANRLKITNVNGNIFNKEMASSKSLDSSETTMDLEYAGSIAPKAKLKMYKSVSSVPSVLNTVNLFNTAYDENNVDTLSTSWGLLDNKDSDLMVKNKVMSDKYLDILNLTFAQGALQGISTFAASGDTGAGNYYMKSIKKNYATVGYSNRAGDVLSSNPWIISCGGTSLPYKRSYSKGTLGFKSKVTVNNPKESAWNSRIIQLFKQDSNLLKRYPELRLDIATGSGGGFEHEYETPSYQKDILGINTFNARKILKKNNYLNPKTPLVRGKDYGRNFPDISANADSVTGYNVYQKSAHESSWNKSGGTSIVAPQMAGAITDLNSKRDSNMGFLNAQIYNLAQSNNSPFNPFNSTDINNNNMYYTGQPGTVYNQATGLGTINFEKLNSTYK